MPDQPTPHTVFVSHAHADNALCDRYVAALRARGLDVWYDRVNMQDGHMLNAEIEAQLEACTAFVVLLTPASVASYWVKLEVAAFRSLAAHDPKRLMLPMRIAECKVPLLMAGIKWIDAVTEGFEAAVEAMSAALGVPASRPIRSSGPQQGEDVTNLMEEGMALYNKNEPANALIFFERATQGAPRNFHAWRYLAITSAMIGRYGEAAAAYTQALALDPTDATAWGGKAFALRQMGLHKEAGEAERRAREMRR